MVEETNLSKRLKAIREAKGYKRKDIARILELSEAAYGYYEKGRNEPSIIKLQELGDLYGMTVSEILGEEKTFIDYAEELDKNQVAHWDGEALSNEEKEKIKAIFEYTLHEMRKKKENSY